MKKKKPLVIPIHDSTKMKGEYRLLLLEIMRLEAEKARLQYEYKKKYRYDSIEDDGLF
jgi:hypothetical protein